MVPERDDSQGPDDHRPQPEQDHYLRHHYETWTIQDWQHQGYQRILTRHESFSINNASAGTIDTMQNPDASIQVEQLGASQRGHSQHDRALMDLFSHSPPLADAAHLSSLFFPPVLPSLTMQQGVLPPASHGVPASPSSEWQRPDRANSRSPRRCGYFGRH